MKIREATLVYRATDRELPARRQFANAEDIFRAYSQYFDALPVERVMAIFVDARNRVLCESMINEGTVDHSVVYARKVFELAILSQASGFILMHNHPSGVAEPSAQDIHLTEGMAVAAKAMGIRFLDHIIVGEGVYTSLRARGILV